VRGRQGELALPAPAPTRAGHGGRRAGAGRKPKGATAELPHARRPRLSRRHPVHVTVRVVREIGRLRRRAAYRCISNAMLRALWRDDFRIVHVSIQATHIHLIVEADDERALTRGIRGFEISAARRLNRTPAATTRRRARKGRVFADRYHAEQLRTPRQVRNAMAYVLNNFLRHREDAGHRWRVDPYASGVAFGGWRGREHVCFAWPPGYEPLPVCFPHTWMLTDGWRRGGTIDLDERPGPR
jgi:REP element-mobilizing transposase RayT